MNLAIDIGNTLTKLAIFNDADIVENKVTEELTDLLLASFFEKYHIKNCIYSTVVNKKEDEILLKKYNFLHLNHLTPLPLSIKYKSPETLGIDRIAAVIGAYSIYKETDILVIDMGTCITFRFFE